MYAFVTYRSHNKKYRVVEGVSISRRFLYRFFQFMDQNAFLFIHMALDDKYCIESFFAGAEDLSAVTISHPKVFENVCMSFISVNAN